MRAAGCKSGDPLPPNFLTLVKKNYSRSYARYLVVIGVLIGEVQQ